MPLRTLLCGVIVAGLARGAEAADARHRLSIPPRSYGDALIDLGAQANATILGTSSCGTGGRVALSGRYTLNEALARLLADAPCRYRVVDARTVSISPAPPEGPTPAREPPRTAPSIIAEVVVTATKRPASLARLPAGVSAIPAAQMRLTGATDVGQTVGQLAGVISTNLGPGRDKLLVRGVSDGAFTGRARSTVSTYLDDVPINYNAPDPDLRLVDIERVEVVRGPQGALYGSGAMSGIYRIVTQKPDLSEARFGVAAGVAATDDGDPSHEVEGYASIPLIRDRAAIRIVAYEDRLGGYLDNVSLRLTNVDRTRRDGGRLALRLQVSDEWRLDALAATQHLRSNDSQYVTSGLMAPGGGSPAMPMEGVEHGLAAADGRLNQVREAHNNDISYVGGVLQGALGAVTLSSSTAYVHHVYSSQYDASSPIGTSDFPFQNRLETIGAYVERARVNMLVQDLVLRSAGERRIDWLLGVYAARTEERTPSELGLISSAGVLTTVYNENRRDELQELALYGEASHDFAGGWTATLGGRVFESRVHTTADLVIAPPGASRAFDRSRTFNGFSPKVSLQKESARGDLVYALVSEGYRPGGFNSGGFFQIQNARLTFQADRLRNYEVGVKLRRDENRLALRAAAYYDDWSDIQTDQYRRSGLAYTGNIGDATIVGVEGELAYDWDFGLSLQAHGLLSDSKVKNANPEALPRPGRNDFALKVAGDLPGVPRISGGVLAVYQRRLGDDFSLRLVGEASYVGRSRLSFDANVPPSVDGYLRARLTAELGTEDWRAQVYVFNPFNDSGDTFAYGNPFSFGRVRQITPQRPRTVGMRLAAGF